MKTRIVTDILDWWGYSRSDSSAASVDEVEIMLPGNTRWRILAATQLTGLSQGFSTPSGPGGFCATRVESVVRETATGQLVRERFPAHASWNTIKTTGCRSVTFRMTTVLAEAYASMLVYLFSEVETPLPTDPSRLRPEQLMVGARLQKGEKRQFTRTFVAFGDAQLPNTSEAQKLTRESARNVWGCRSTQIETIVIQQRIPRGPFTIDWIKRRLEASKRALLRPC